MKKGKDKTPEVIENYEKVYNLLEKAKKNGEQPKDLNPRAEKLLKLIENLIQNT